MNIEIILMNGYGLYVWSSFIFTFLCFTGLYLSIRLQLKKEQEKFKEKYFDLAKEKTAQVKKQKTYKEILVFTKISKI